MILVYTDEQRKKAEELVHTMVKRAVEMEGTVTVSLFGRFPILLGCVC